MGNIKTTTKADIEKKRLALGKIMKDVKDLQILKSTVHSKLNTIFSENCAECSKHAGFIITARNLFQATSIEVLAENLDQLYTYLEITNTYPHWDDCITNESN